MIALDPSGYVTYYKDEESHSRFDEAHQWFTDQILSEILDDYKGEVILAGGALRSYFTNTKVRDYDLYGSKKFVEAASGMRIFEAGAWNWRLITETNTSWVFKRLGYDLHRQEVVDRSFNVIKQPVDLPGSAIEKFDLTVCMCAINQDQITYHPDYFTDLATRTLRVNSYEDPLSTLWRLQKYTKLGYSIDKPELWRLVQAIHELPKLPEIEAAVEEEKVEKEKQSWLMKLGEIFKSS